MLLSLNFRPVAQWKHREFTASDPWADGRPVVWSIVVYKMVGESFLNAVKRDAQSVPSGSNQLPKALVAGIFSQTHNRFRILPLALQDLWREGRVVDADLPWLLHHVEGRLRRSDYPPARGQLVLKVLSAALAAASLVSCGSAAEGFVTGAYFAIGSCLCLIADLVLRERRKEFTRTWFRILTER